MKIYITVVALFFLALGCEDSFDKKPQGYPIADEFYENLSEMYLAVNAIYDVLGADIWQQNYARIGSGASDEMNHQNTTLSPHGKVITFNATPENTHIVNYWRVSYMGIFRANMVIANANRVAIYDEVSGSHESFHDMLGQAKFLRAFFYFNLVRTFGGVPIKPEVFSIDANGNDNFMQPRSSVEEVYNYIEKDLREASILLYANDRGATDNRGRVMRAAALGMLAKVVAYQAEHGVNDPRWEEVLTLTDHLVNFSELTVGDVLNLEEAYEDENLADIAKRLRYPDATLSESTILYNKYDLALSNSYDLMFHQEGENTPEWMFYVNHISNSTTPFLYGSNSGFPGGLGNLGDLQANNYYGNLGYSTGDPRLLGAIAGPGRVVYQGAGYPSYALGWVSDPSKTRNLKWSTYLSDAAPRGNDAGKNFNIFRYGEVILWHAEALNETGDQIQAVDELNKLRARANLIPESRLIGVSSSLKDVAYGTYLQVKDAVWTERQHELFFEFDRFYDMQRMGIAAEQINKKNGSLTPDYQVKYIHEIHQVFPIPQWEVEISNGVVVQNPGY